MKCKICGSDCSEFGNGTYYLEDGKVFPVPFFYCKNCNCFIRKVGTDSIISHLKSASHTNIKNEKKFYDARIDFFKYIFIVTEKYSKSIENWLDFGSSYGHFIDFLKNRGLDCDGIEIDESVRKYSRNKGLSVFESIDKLPEGKVYDVISLIDSLYYSYDPTALIKSVYNKTVDNGLVVLRVTNRNWLAKLKKRILRKDIGLSLGDATISYSRKSIKFLLENNGFEILKISVTEKGKAIDKLTKLFYVFTAVLNFISIGLISISPGLIVIAKKNSDSKL